MSDIDYAMVSGIVKPDEFGVYSRFNSQHFGVLRITKNTEFFSRWKKENESMIVEISKILTR